MSWSLYVVPLHALSREDLAQWPAGAPFARGVPATPPPAQPLPTVAEVLDAFRAAGCHGTNWFTVVGEPAGTRLPECPDAGSCASAGGPDLGEVSVHTAGAASGLPAVPAGAPVETVSFRKPNPGAVLAAVCALASLAGPQLVFDESAEDVWVARPGDEADRLREEWPW